MFPFQDSQLPCVVVIVNNTYWQGEEFKRRNKVLHDAMLTELPGCLKKSKCPEPRKQQLEEVVKLDQKPILVDRIVEFGGLTMAMMGRDATAPGELLGCTLAKDSNDILCVLSYVVPLEQAMGDGSAAPLYEVTQLK